MAPSRRKGGGKAAAVAAACRQWKVGDLVLAKVKGFPAWPAAVTEPEKWGYSTDWKKVLVHFFGTQQIAFCNPSDVEAFTEEKKQLLLTKRHAKGSDFVRALKEIIDSYDKLKAQDQAGDPKSAVEATLGNAENTTLLPQVNENPTGTSLGTQIKSDPSHARDESTLLNEDASAAEQMLALRNKACESEVVKEPRKIATYSSRRRSGGPQSQKCAPQKKMCSVQRSKSSSKVQSDKFQTSMLQCSDGGQSIDDVEDGGVRRRKRIRRSSGHSESDDVASSTLNAHGSDEENASEIATVESDNNIRNEGNGVDSGSNVEKIDTGGQFLGDYDLNKVLDFQINAMVKRKKRKPTRKREISDVDPFAKVEAEAVLEAGARDNAQTSQNSHNRFTERPSEENGDEHLPLVKRARVRMSRAFCGDHEANGSSHGEERSFKDSLVDATAHTSNSDIVSSHDTCAVGESKFFEVSAKLPADMVNVVPCPSEACVKNLDDSEYAMGWNELSKAPNNEAAETQSNQVSSSTGVEAVTASVTEDVTASVTEDVTASVTEDVTEAVTASVTEDVTEAATASVTEAATASVTEAATASVTEAATASVTEAATASVTEAATASVTEAGTASVTEAATATGTEAVTATGTEAVTATGTEAVTATLTEAVTATVAEAVTDTVAEAVTDTVIKAVTATVTEAVTATVTEAVCSGDSQPMKLPTSESDLSVVHCLRQVATVETHLDPNTVDSYSNKTSGIYSPGVLSLLSLQHRSHDQGSCDSLDNSRESLNEEGGGNDACVARVVQSEAIDNFSSSCLMVYKQETENMLLKEEHGSPEKEYDKVEPTQTTPNPPISVTESAVMVDDSEHPQGTRYCKCEDVVQSSGPLEIVGEGREADDQKQQVQTNNSVSVYENHSHEKMSLSPANIADTPVRGSSHSNLVYHISTAESANGMQNNNSCSPNVQSGEKKTVCDVIVKEEEKIDSGVCQGQKVVSSDVQSTRESFEDALSSLVRTKESIGRATRLAMDLMRFGLSGKAMEILAHTLESESNLQRRVDLFFLVDSIAQCSKGLKGDTGFVYLSAIQVILPRLLAAAVPAGATTQENQTQCLKVLRLWLERRILPESIVRHHIRELDSHRVVPACLYSRRSARTERSLDDPVRDMEGMLVDEYGSNSTLQLPGFCMPAMLKDDEGESDSDGGDFESVTPEHESRILKENVSSSTAERHTLILEDVEGELEMEDVAPPWETGNCTHSDQADDTKATNCKLGRQHGPVSGTSHQHMSLSSPRLPSSSPPPPPAPPSQQAQCAMPDSYSNGFDSGYPIMHGEHKAAPPRMNTSLSGNTMHYQVPESSYSSGVQLTNSMPQAEGSNFQHRPYPSHPHPPPPPSQHQYSFPEPGHQMKSRRDGPSYSHRSHYVPNFDERNFHDNHERMRHAPYENRDSWRYPPSSSYGSRYQDKHKDPYPSSSYNSGPPRESGRFQNHRWNNPPRPYNSRQSFHPKQHSEGHVPLAMRDPGMWHQRGD